MRYDQMLYESMAMYPSLFPTEDEFLHHVFFVNGNGLEWVDGEVCCVFEYDEPFEVRLAKKQAEDAAHRQEWEAETARDAAWYISLNYPSEFMAEFRVMREYDNVFKPNHCTRIYPMCQFATILEIPEDAAHDWLDAAVRALELSKRLKKTKEDIAWLKIAREKVNAARGAR